jgi:hypothetical protein
VPGFRAGTGPKAARVGTTFCDPEAPLVLEPPSAADPVVSVAVEARRAADTGRLAQTTSGHWGITRLVPGGGFPLAAVGQPEEDMRGFQCLTRDGEQIEADFV